MRDRFIQLSKRYYLETKKTEALAEEYRNIEPKLMTIKAIKNQMEEIKKASVELAFHQERYKAVI